MGMSVQSSEGGEGALPFVNRQSPRTDGGAHGKLRSVVGWLLSAFGLALIAGAVTMLVRSGLGRPIATTGAACVGFAAGCAGVGLVRRRLTLKHFCFLAIIAFASLLLLEVSARVAFAVRRTFGTQPRAYSAKLGWVTRANQSLTYDLPRYGRVQYSTDRYGFRVFGDPKSDKLRVLVIGDSFTAAGTVSDGSPYYSKLAASNPGIEVFAYGCGGYGTLQEYMILDEVWDEIKPQLLVLQFSSNDIINNDCALESASVSNNNHMTRPYLRDSQIKMRFPCQDYGPLYKLVQYSEVLRLLRVQANWLKTRQGAAVETELQSGHPGLLRSAETTSEVLQLVRRRAGTIPVVLFASDETEWSGPLIRTIAEHHHIQYVDGVPAAIAQAKREGKVVDGSPVDAHWNAAGHEIAAQILSESLRELRLIPVK
jgi:hypothetical protein